MFSKLCWHGNTCYCVVISDIVYSIIQDHNCKEKERPALRTNNHMGMAHGYMLGKLIVTCLESCALSGKLHSYVLGEALLL